MSRGSTGRWSPASTSAAASRPPDLPFSNLSDRASPANARPRHWSGPLWAMRPSSCCRQPWRPARVGRQRSLATASACLSERGWASDSPHGGYLVEGYLDPAEPLVTHSHGSSQEEEFMGKR